MRITILGCGSSGGVPLITGDWGRCDPSNPRNKRRRASILIEYNDKTILIDAGPDLRLQLLDAGVNRIDAVIFTHSHSDHIFGIHELRVLSLAHKQIIPLYCDEITMGEIYQSYRYALDPKDKNYKPFIELIPVREGAHLYGKDFLMLPQHHGNQISYAIRVENFAYSTDFSEIPDQSLSQLNQLDFWIADCLQFEPHLTHSHFDKTMEYISQLKPKRTILTHMNQNFDYAEGVNRVPHGVEVGYDGMTIDV